ncbi:Helix-turn-helix transcriptional regulator [Candidatus Megaera venefica]|uniref:Helix-turn-helix transcriptional regulator n=1 Tax=Candidatus Megaera venefica TaxID=2055910 RepID=A0ABU5NER8_9RICK|nr:helix-turn-helix transcriptional regulator [Candidatus Megaera venefica]MEA0971673.1 Helix-turn-helix transcriptional regulator [Candidatus Megaera venefica]
MKHIDDQLDKIDKLIGKKIYNLKVDRDMSRSDLAKKAGVSQQQIAKYEDSTNKISASRLALLASVLNKDISYFYESI